MKTMEEIEEYSHAFSPEKPTEEMDPESIAYGMRLARDAFKHLVAGAIEIAKANGNEKETGLLQIMLESLDGMPIDAAISTGMDGENG